MNGERTLYLEAGRLVPRDGPPQFDEDFVALRTGPFDSACACVLLEDTWPLVKLITRVLIRAFPGALAVYHCKSKGAVRQLHRYLARREEPVVAFMTGTFHPGGSGIEELAFLANAPPDFAFGTIAARSVPRLLMSGFSSFEEQRSAIGYGYLFKPFRVPELIDWLRDSLDDLLDAVGRDLEASNGADVVTGVACWGTPAAVAGAQGRIEEVIAAHPPHPAGSHNSRSE